MMRESRPFYGWKLVGVFFAVYFFNISFPYYGGVVINSFMSADLGLNRSMLGLGFSLFAISLGLSSPLVATLVTRFGTRRTLLCGGAVLVSGSLLMAFGVTATWHYVLYFGVIIGIGTGMGSMIPIQSSIAFWFKRRRATANAVVISASGVSALIAAPLLARIIDFTGNWRMGWIAVAIAVFAATMIAAFGVIDKPEQIGQFPDGIDPNAPGTAADDGKPVSRVYQSHVNWSARDALRTRSWWLLVLGSISFLVPFNIAMGHGVVHLLDLGHSKELASFSVGLVVMSSIAGRLFGGWLGDRVEPRFIWCFALGLMFAGMFFLKNVTSAWMIYAYAATLGIGMGASYVCMITLVGNYFGANSFAQIMGLLFPIVNVLAAFSPILAGIAYDLAGSYAKAFFGAMLIALLGAFSMPYAGPPGKKSNETGQV